jgi:hypothetical protein
VSAKSGKTRTTLPSRVEHEGRDTLIALYVNAPRHLLQYHNVLIDTLAKVQPSRGAAANSRP